MEAKPKDATEIFICYAREDEEYRKSLEKQLIVLQHQDLINIWHDREIAPGMDWKQEIDSHLNAADIILLLVSPDFMVSKYCYGIEMVKAIKRHELGEAHVIPIIIRHVYWKRTPFGELQALPTDGVPVTDPHWHTTDIAFFNVAEGIRNVIETIHEERQHKAEEERLRRAEEERQRNAETERLHRLEEQVNSKPSQLQTSENRVKSESGTPLMSRQQPILPSSEDQSASDHSSSPKPYQSQQQKQIATKNATKKFGIVILSSLALFFITTILFYIVNAPGPLYWIPLFFMVFAIITGFVVANTMEKQKRN